MVCFVPEPSHISPGCSFNSEQLSYATQKSSDARFLSRKQTHWSRREARGFQICETRVAIDSSLWPDAHHTTLLCDYSRKLLFKAQWWRFACICGIGHSVLVVIVAS